MNPTDPTPLPCPFCGSELFPVAGNFVAHPHETDCILRGAAYKVAHWNTRAPSAELAPSSTRVVELLAEVERLNGALREQTEISRSLEKILETKPSDATLASLSAELAQAQAEAAAMREKLQVINADAELLERLRKAEALAKHFLPTTTENTKPQ